MADNKAIIDLVARDKRFQPVMNRVLTTMRGVQARMEAVAATARKMLLVGTGLATGVIAVFGLFEKRMARVQALTQATAEEFAALSTEARRLGSATVFSASQAAQAMGAFAQQGFKANEIIKSMNATLALAAAGQLDMGQAAAITAGIMKSMKLPVEELTRVADVLAFTFTNSATDMIQLGEAMKSVGPVAAKAGFSLEEVTATIRAFSDVMIQGSAAGLALRNIILRLASQPSEVKKALSQLNVTIADSTGRMKPLARIIDEVSASMQNMSEVQQGAITTQLAGMRAAAAFTELLQLGGDTIREYTEENERAGGTVGRIAKQQMNNIIDKFKLLTSAVQEATIKIGEQFSPHVEALSGIVTELVGRFNELDKTTIGIGIVLAEVGVATAAVVLAMKAAISLATGFTGMLTTASVAGSGLALAMTKVATTTTAATAATAALFAPIKAAQAAAVAAGWSSLFYADSLAIATISANASAIAVARLGAQLGAAAVAARVAATTIAVGLTAGMGALAVGIGAAVLAMGKARAQLKQISQTSLEAGASMDRLAEAMKKLRSARGTDERKAGLVALLGALKGEKTSIEKQLEEIREMQEGSTGFLAGDIGRGALADTEAQLSGRLQNIREQTVATTKALDQLNKRLKAPPPKRDPADAKQFRVDKIRDAAIALADLGEQEKLLGAIEQLRLQGIEDLTDAELKYIEGAIEYAEVTEQMRRANENVQQTVRALGDELRIMAGLADEAAVAMRNAIAAGADPRLAQQMGELIRLQDALAKSQQHERGLKAEADAIRKAIRTKKEQLQLDLQRIEVLRQIGKLTQAEADQASKLARERAAENAQDNSRTGAREGLDQLFNRIAVAAARPAAGADPQMAMAVDMKAVANAVQEENRKAQVGRDLLKRIKEILEQIQRDGGLG